MTADNIIASAAACIAAIAALVAIWQSHSASQQAESAREQADAAGKQVEAAREQADAAGKQVEAAREQAKEARRAADATEEQLRLSRSAQLYDQRVMAIGAMTRLQNAAWTYRKFLLEKSIELEDEGKKGVSSAERLAVLTPEVSQISSAAVELAAITRDLPAARYAEDFYSTFGTVVRTARSLRDGNIDAAPVLRRMSKSLKNAEDKLVKSVFWSLYPVEHEPSRDDERQATVDLQ